VSGGLCRANGSEWEEGNIIWFVRGVDKLREMTTMRKQNENTGSFSPVKPQEQSMVEKREKSGLQAGFF